VTRCWCRQILEEQHALFFHLQQQRLIELIRGGQTEAALSFAQEYLAPQGEEHPAFLEELGEGPGRRGRGGRESSTGGCRGGEQHGWVSGRRAGGADRRRGRT
jgi:hypothetical protein